VLSPRLQLRQSQALVMTPQLMQAIKLLQLSNLDLAAYVENEIERNPLLDKAVEDDGPAERSADDAMPLTVSGGDATAGDWLGEALEVSRAGLEQGLGTELENVFPDDGPQEAAMPAGEAAPTSFAEWGLSSGGGADSEYNLEGFVSAAVTLPDHLAQQLVLAIADPVRRIIGQHLIDMIDETGYLAGDIEAVIEQLGSTRAEVEAVLAIVQTFEPTGIGARSLSECLAIQLRERDRLDPTMQAFLANLHLLAARDFAALKRACRIDDEDLAEMIKEIRALDPKPGLAFGASPAQPIVPDVFVRPLPDGTWHVELNSDTLPRVLVNQAYYAKVSKSAREVDAKSYLSECMQTATWLVKALDQRAKTVMKVSSEIVRQQDGFFAHGVRHLRPLNLKTVADAIAMHESTVSRVTANKYMATPRGIFELKYFFSAAIASADGGESHSAEAVRHQIRQLIDAEAPRDVLSDDAIVEKLRATGIDIARRTVAKYREALRIPSSVQRRREKLAQSAASPAAHP
jgi:RNA polymerase sigma-54 factor